MNKNRHNIAGGIRKIQYKGRGVCVPHSSEPASATRHRAEGRGRQDGGARRLLRLRQVHDPSATAALLRP